MYRRTWLSRERNRSARPVIAKTHDQIATVYDSAYPNVFRPAEAGASSGVAPTSRRQVDVATIATARCPGHCRRQT